MCSINGFLLVMARKVFRQPRSRSPSLQNKSFSLTRTPPGALAEASPAAAAAAEAEEKHKRISVNARHLRININLYSFVNITKGLYKIN